MKASEKRKMALNLDKKMKVDAKRKNMKKDSKKDCSY
jgi:hypothetical protein